MKKLKTYLLLMCLSVFSWHAQAQLVDVYKGTSLPNTQGWTELRFDNSMSWEQEAKDLLVPPSELSAVAASALKLKANKALDLSGYPLYSQLGYYYPNTGFSTTVGFTVEFKAKVINSENGAFTVSGVGGGKGFRLELSNNMLTEHANVLDTVRVLSTASNTDGFHVYRVVVAPDETVRVWRDGTFLGSLPLQPFKLDNIINDGGFEKGGTPEDHGWVWMDEGKAGTLTVSNNAEHVRTGKYGLFVNKGYFKNEFIPVKPEAVYDMNMWGKMINFPEGAWRDMEGWFDPGGSRHLYAVADRNNRNWKEYKWDSGDDNWRNQQGIQGGASHSRFILTTPTSDMNQNQMVYDDILFTERMTPSRIPHDAVNLFPNGDFEDPDFDYFPSGDPRNDTSIVNPNNYKQFLTYYSDWTEEQIGKALYDWDETPFWHPFWHSRVRTQSGKQGNGESGNLWARGKHSLRYFNCFSNTVPYGTDFRAARAQGRNTPLYAELPLEVGKTYTFSFWYHFASWGGDHLKLHVNNGDVQLWYKDVNNKDFPNWQNVVLTFTTTEENHTLRFFTENTNEKSGHDTWGDPGVLFFDDFFLFEGNPLPAYDGSHVFFGKQTSTDGAEVEIEYVKISNSGAYTPDGTPIPAPYVKKTAPLMTTWGENLVATDPILNEYPRPQLKRSEWTNLNGVWDFTRKGSLDGFGTYNGAEGYRTQILVPYPVESALSGIKDVDYDNKNKFYAYKKDVSLTKPTDGKRIILHFGAVDWESYVFVNGTQVVHHKGGFDPFSADITDALNAGSTQEIIVQAYDPTLGGQPSGKQHAAPGASWYTPASGIWQTVWTEVVNPTHVTDLTLTPVNNAAVKVKVNASAAEGVTAVVKVLDGTTEVASQEVAIGVETDIAISNPKLWSPESPFLYNVKVDLKKGGTSTDVVTSYFGMRKIEVKQLREKPFIYLNDEPSFSYGTLDHGYYPDGIFTPASYNVIRHDLKKLKELGFNAVRKFEKIEPAVWYHIADSLGLLVWQDIPAAHTGNTGSVAVTPIAEFSTENARKANFLRETEAMTKSIRNFTSVVAWIGFNDGWGKYGYDHVKNTVDLFRSLNDGRLVVPESGSDSYELGDVVSSLGIPIPNLHTNSYNQRASICGVTGSYSYVIDGHIWNTSSSSEIKNDSAYAANLKKFADAAKTLTLSGMSGMAMVQTTDCEDEVNGLMTYDRKVYKAGVKADSVLRDNIAFMKEKIVAPILKTSIQGGEMWKYISGNKDDVSPVGWNENGFDDSSWKEGRAGFGGNMSNANIPIRTTWKGDNISLHLRKNVTIPVLQEGDNLQFKMFYDEDFEFYINGVLAHSGIGWTKDGVYETFDITSEAAAAINYGGENLFAIHVIQNSGGSYMDLGVTTNKVSKPIDYEPEPVPIVWKEIATPEDWKNIENDLDGFYKLTDDIDLSVESEYKMIGSTDAPFRGYIDGQNKTVRCPEIRGNDRVGLFSYADGAHFVNLRITDAFVSGGTDVGILLGRGKGVTVEHVVFDKGSYPTEVYGRDHVGAVAGMLESGKVSTIKDVYVVDGIVESSEWQAAGLVGIICDTRIINSYFTGHVSITSSDRLEKDNADAGGIVARTEGGKNFFTGVMSLADSVMSASGNEFIAYNGGGYIVIDSATCFTRNNMELLPLKAPKRGNQFARATESMKRPDAEFKDYGIYRRAGWDMVNVWGIPAGGGYPVFLYLDGIPDSTPSVVEKENNLKVYSKDGNLIMTSTELTSVWIYNIQGTLVERIDVNGTEYVALPRGIYIVKSAANKVVNAVKVINK